MTPLHHLTDHELLRAADNAEPLSATDLQVELRERFAALLDDLGRLEQVEATLDDAGIDCGKTADIERLERAVKFDTQHDTQVVARLVAVCAAEDIYDASDFERLVQRTKRFAIRLADAGLADD